MTAPAMPPAMRLKSQWFKPGERPPAELASAAAFLVFRIGNQLLKRMRGAAFDIDAGTPYFAFLTETLVFLYAVTDRMAHAHFDAQARAAFTTALARHLARHVAENQFDLLGPEPPGTPPYPVRFLQQLDALGEHYAEFGADPTLPAAPGRFHPDFAFVRYLGVRLEPTLPEKDRRWVLDQVMATEAPEALAQLQRTIGELFDPPLRRARRAAVSGE